jgi:hypothetical protein
MLSFTKNTTHLIVAGKTFPLKEALKALGARWDSSLSAWTLPVHLDSEHLRNDLNNKLKDVEVLERAEKKKEKEAAAAARAYALTPEGQAAAKVAAKARVLWALEQKKKTGSYHWICCEHCEVIDWTRQHTSCDPCGSGEGIYRNTFRVRGNIYTGD